VKPLPLLRAIHLLISDPILLDKMQTEDPILRAKEQSEDLTHHDLKEDPILHGKEKDALIHHVKAGKDGPIHHVKVGKDGPIHHAKVERGDPIHHVKVGKDALIHRVKVARDGPILRDLRESVDLTLHEKAVPIHPEQIGLIRHEQMGVLGQNIEDLIPQDLKATLSSNAHFHQSQMVNSRKPARKAFPLLKKRGKSDSAMKRAPGKKSTATLKHKRRLSMPSALLTHAIDKAYALILKTTYGARNAPKNSAWSFRKR
jgi:hypothetical protein